MTEFNYMPFFGATLERDPCDFFIVRNFISAEAVAEVNKFFPKIAYTGPILVENMTALGEFKTLLKDLRGEEFIKTVGEKMQTDLSAFPLAMSVNRWLNPLETDSITDNETTEIKVILFLNDPQWKDEQNGMFLMLHSGLEEAEIVREVIPRGGTLVSLNCNRHAWHKITPFTEEYHFIQLSWYRNRLALEKARLRNKLRIMFHP